MADIDVTQYTIGDNTYHYRDGSMISELANKVNYTDVEDTLDNTSTMPIQNKTVADAIQDLDDTKLDITDIDDHLDITSENPVQNQVIAEKLNDIGDYARPISSEELEGHAGIVRVGSTLKMNEVEGTPGFLDVKNPTLITPVTFPEETETVKIADFIDNYGTVGELRAPQGGGSSGTNVIIDPKTILGNKLLIADYWIDGVKGELWAPAGGNGEALKEEIYTNEGTTATDITLDDDYDKYDLLYFTVIKQAGGETTKVITSIETSKIILGDFIQVMGGSAGADWLIYEVNSKTSFELDNTPSGVYIESIVGIGLGSGDKVSVTQKTSTGTNIATVTINNVDIELYAPTITIDSAIDATSENPVQNKVIKTALDGKVDTNGTDRLMTDAEGVKLAGIAAGAEVNVQANWNESDNTSDAYIANKPTIPSALDDLSDVSTTGVSNGQVLTYNGTNWEGATPSAGTITDVQVDNVSVVSSGVANISTMTGAGASAAGAKGLVPAPASGDNTKFLAGDGTWKDIQGGGSFVDLTPAEYVELPTEQKEDATKLYMIAGTSATQIAVDQTSTNVNIKKEAAMSVTSSSGSNIIAWNGGTTIGCELDYIAAIDVTDVDEVKYDLVTRTCYSHNNQNVEEQTTERFQIQIGVVSTLPLTGWISDNLSLFEVYNTHKYTNTTYTAANCTLDVSQVTGNVYIVISAHGWNLTLSNLRYIQIGTSQERYIKYKDLEYANLGDGITDVKVDNVSVVTSGIANINTMTGADGSVAGSKGLVPAPASTDNDKFLKGDGTWATPSGGGGTTVIANPSGTPTEALTSIQIGNTIYSISGGSGQTVIETVSNDTTQNERIYNENIIIEQV